MVVSTLPFYGLGDMIWKDIDQDGIQDVWGGGSCRCEILPSTTHPMRSLEQILQIVVVSMSSVT